VVGPQRFRQVHARQAAGRAEKGDGRRPTPGRVVRNSDLLTSAGSPCVRRDVGVAYFSETPENQIVGLANSVEEDWRFLEPRSLPGKPSAARVDEMLAMFDLTEAPQSRAATCSPAARSSGRLRGQAIPRRALVLDEPPASPSTPTVVNEPSWRPGHRLATCDGLNHRAGDPGDGRGAAGRQGRGAGARDGGLRRPVRGAVRAEPVWCDLSRPAYSRRGRPSRWRSRGRRLVPLPLTVEELVERLGTESSVMGLSIECEHVGSPTMRAARCCRRSST